MLPFKVIFQSLDRNIFLKFILHGISAIQMQKSTISQQLFIAAFSQIYSPGNYYILLMFVLLFINFTKVIERETESLQ